MAALLAASASAPGALVTHSTEGTLFDETYESQTVGAIPASGAIAPGGNGENWSPDIGGSSTILTRDSASDAALDANQGSRYVRLERPTEGRSALLGHWPSTNIDTGVLTLKFAAYIPTTAASRGLTLIVDQGSGATPGFEQRGIQLITEPGGFVVRRLFDLNAGDPYTNTGVTYTPDTWQDWTIVYSLVPGVDNDTFDLTVGASSVSGLDAFNDITDVRQFSLEAGGNGSVVYFDAQVIPEPASAGVMVLGVWALVVRRRGCEA